MFRDATRMVTLVAAAMRLADFDVERLAARAGDGGTTLTELADTLVRDHGLPFRAAHAIAALLLKGGYPLAYIPPEMVKVPLCPITCTVCGAMIISSWGLTGH